MGQGRSPGLSQGLPGGKVKAPGSVGHDDPLSGSAIQPAGDSAGEEEVLDADARRPSMVSPLPATNGVPSIQSTPSIAYAGNRSCSAPMLDLRSTFREPEALPQSTKLACDIGCYLTVMDQEELKRVDEGRYIDTNRRELVSHDGKVRWGHVWPVILKRVG